MYNLRNIHQRQSFKSFVNEQMKESLITGVPEIVNSKSSARRAVKSIMFLLCTAVFFYQTYDFLESFLKYETIQNFRLEYPTQFMAPAVTFCHRKGHQKYPNLSNEFLDASGPQSPWHYILTSNDENCWSRIAGWVHRCKKNDSILIQASSGELLYKCFSLFSLLDKPNEEPINMIIFDSYTLVLSSYLNRDMDVNGKAQFYMYVHDPRRLANPISEGFTIHAGYIYTFSLSMQQIHSLPPPYTTYCVDYVKKWKENGGRGPLTKKDCIELCKIERMMEQHNCVGRSITYPHRFPICSEVITVSHKVAEDCSSGCREACDVTLYTVPVVHKEKGPDTVVQLTLKFNQLSVEKIFMEPKFQNIELFSYIGGFMGLWLGICLVTFVDFLETVTDVIIFAAMKLKKMREKKTIFRRFLH